MSLYPLIDIQTNIRDLIHFSIHDEESRDQWLDDFESILKDLNIRKMLNIGNYTLTLKLTLLTYDAEIELIGEEEAVAQLQKDSHLQEICVKLIHELINEYNMALLSESIARVPNAYLLWKDDKFYVEIAPGQTSLDIEFRTIQFDIDFDERNIEWEYLV